jgi:ABC-type cobalt transport system substrate-binding protein
MGRCGAASPGEIASILCEAVYAPPFEIFFKPSSGRQVCLLLAVTAIVMHYTLGLSSLH